MIESHLVAGRQDLAPGKPLTYGQSITDGCIGWDDTVQALDGAPIDSPDEALAAYGRLRAGERVSVTLNRRGATMQRTAQLRPE